MCGFCFFFPKAVHLEEMAETTTDMLIQRPEERADEHSPEKVNMQSEWQPTGFNRTNAVYTLNELRLVL